MYRSASGRFFLFNVGRRGEVEQWELTSAADVVDFKKLRNFRLRGKAEACAADDDVGALYISEEETGIWRFDAEPESLGKPRLIDRVGSGGHLQADVEGVAIYKKDNGKGYLIASSQGDDRYTIYQRSTNAFIAEFRISGGVVDGVSNTDGIEVTNHALGPNFPRGILVAQDGKNIDSILSSRRQNFKLVAWESIASGMAMINSTGRAGPVSQKPPSN
jgi:3-phytase